MIGLKEKLILSVCAFGVIAFLLMTIKLQSAKLEIKKEKIAALNNQINSLIDINYENVKEINRLEELNAINDNIMKKLTIENINNEKALNDFRRNYEQLERRNDEIKNFNNIPIPEPIRCLLNPSDCDQKGEHLPFSAGRTVNN